MRGATTSPRRLWHSIPGFNPRPSCEGRPAQGRQATRYRTVSIHAPHARGDVRHVVARVPHPVSIHAPHARGDGLSLNISCLPFLFQSTPLMRGATSACRSRTRRGCRFNPRPSCEGRPLSRNACMAGVRFQSTPLMRGATCLQLRRLP